MTTPDNAQPPRHAGTRTERAVPEVTVSHDLYMRDGGWWVRRVEATLIAHHTDRDSAVREALILDSEASV